MAEELLDALVLTPADARAVAVRLLLAAEKADAPERAAKASPPTPPGS